MRIYIAEDLALYREGVEKVCSSVTGWTVVGTAADGVEALRDVLTLRPEALILDLSLPGLDGFAIAADVRRHAPEIKIVVLSCYGYGDMAVRLDRIGVHGFVDKNSDSIGQVVQALRTVAGGDLWFSATFLTALTAAKADPHAVGNRLSKSEQRVMAGIAKGLSDQDIGITLGITRATAQTHRSKILRKLKIVGTPKLVVYALARGFGIGR